MMNIPLSLRYTIFSLAASTQSCTTQAASRGAVCRGKVR